VGKWHLGHLPQFLPTRQGFDSYFGIPYSNDMDRRGGGNYIESCRNGKVENFNVPLLRDEEVIERPANQHTITKRYTEEAVRFIKEKKDGPFFLYLAHSLPHVPLFRSEEFVGKSRRGIYGDVIEEIDWSVGRVLDTIRENGLADNSLVVFTSDNGPWLMFDDHGGSAGLLRGGKGGTFEGGMREPTIFWGPGIVQPGVVPDMGSTLDLLPTFCALAGAPLPEDRVLDGVDLAPVLRGHAASPRKTMIYYRGTEAYAVRHGSFKAHFITQPEYGGGGPKRHDPPLLYNLDVDPSEKYDVAKGHPGVIEAIREVLAKHLQTVKSVPNQLEMR
jgi:arylsulfatase A-like enzyme